MTSIQYCAKCLAKAVGEETNKQANSPKISRLGGNKSSDLDLFADDIISKNRKTITINSTRL